jgi:hypothetical protein
MLSAPEVNAAVMAAAIARLWTLEKQAAADS